MSRRVAAIAGFLGTVVAVYVALWSRWRIPGFPIRLTDVTESSGLDFQHTDGSSGKKYIVEYVASGFATFDFDQDGLVDIYFVNGCRLPHDGPDGAAGNALYRNLGNMRFCSVTRQAGVGDPGYGLGATVGDCDNDGDQDLYVSNFGPNVLYANNGDGTFTDVTERAGVGDGDKVGAGVAFFDMEGDGDLDLYVANYVDFRFETYQPRIVEGFHVYPGPMEYSPVNDTLFRNNGDGTFTDVTSASGIGDYAGTGMGMVCADCDHDRDTDIFVLNDVAQNFFFENDGKGHFTEASVFSALAYNGQGHSLGSMGVDCGDFDNDGRLDFFQTSYAGELPALFRNLGQGVFEDVTAVTGAGTTTLPHVNWGTGFVDLDNDGDRDLFLANGHLQDNISAYDSSAFYEARNTVLMNTGDGRFSDVSDLCGDGMQSALSSRGSALEDLDNDGDTDIVILNSRCASTLIRNDSSPDHHWLQVRLRGVTDNRDGVGAHVLVTTPDGVTQVQEVHSGRGYQGHFGTRLHFGLGQHERADRIQVKWMDGSLDALDDCPADQRILVLQGQGASRQFR